MIPAATAAALARLNGLGTAEAELELLDCCGARRWARRMTSSRPFASREEVAAACDRAFEELEAGDWLEAFARHPRIGEAAATGRQSGRGERWSEAEQSAARSGGAAGADGADRADIGDRTADVVRRALADGNRRYERRFGYAYIVCASGRSADEMLALLERRLDHEPAFELSVATDEQRRITQLRLERMLRG